VTKLSVKRKRKKRNARERPSGKKATVEEKEEAAIEK
jgi:hypothetical protein